MSAWAEHQRQVQLLEDYSGMKCGPYFDRKRGELRIPSYIFSERAKAEWKRRGLSYDSLRQEWFKAIPADRAVEQVEKASVVYFAFWTF